MTAPFKIKHGNTAPEYSLYMGNGCSIVGKGDVLLLRTQPAVLHFAIIQHTRSAVDNQFVGGKVFGEIASGVKTIIRLLSGIIFYPMGKFHSADVVALAVVGTAFANQDFVTILYQ